MTAHQAVHRVTTMCRVLGVSPSGYYAWRKRPLTPRARAAVELTAQIEAVHRDSRGTYGAPRIHAELAAQGTHIGRQRIARLMRAVGLPGVSRWTVRTTVRNETVRPAPDLVDRQFTAAGPDRLWSRTSPTSPRGPASCISPSCSMRGAAASSAGRWRRICARSSSWPRSTWRSRSGGRPA